ncbi:hypothetical protein RHECNPAF_35000110 [Rhizobium etli CNPAF512]|nr:hypothetical protein RHECNPAF_35000110 [Rhizobium etli CNPAF512]
MKLKIGVRSIMSATSLVVHAPLDEAELEDGEKDDERHQDDRLGGRTGIIEPPETVEIDLVDHQLGRARRSALCHDVDDAEGILEAFGDVDDEQEKQCRRQQRQLQVPHAAQRPRAVHGRGLDQRARNALKGRKEEDEIIADIFPGKGDDDGDHRVLAVECRVPEAGPDMIDDGEKTGFRRQDEAEGETESGRGNRVGPDKDRPVDFVAAQFTVRQQRQDERHPHGDRRRAEAEDHAAGDRLPIDGIAEQLLKIVETDPGIAAAPWLLERERPIERLRTRPIEEDEDQQQHRKGEEQSDCRRGESDALFHEWSFSPGLFGRGRQCASATDEESLQRRTRRAQGGRCDACQAIREAERSCKSAGSGAAAGCRDRQRHRAKPGRRHC